MTTIRLTMVRSACLGGVAAIGLTALSAPASAQSLDELRRQVETLTRRIEQLESQQRSSPGGAAPAGAEGLVESGTDSVRLTLSGQVNRGVLYGDNGTDSEVFHVDNDNSSTRIRFIGEGDLNDDITVGTQIEVQFESNSTADISFNQGGSVGDNNFTERKLELYFDSDQFGRVWLGQGDTASNGTSEVDLSGTSVVAYSGIGDMAGGLAFEGPLRDIDNDPGTPDAPVRIKDAFNNFDGLSRDDRLRYDTPNFGGFTASASAVRTDDWDAALRFSGEIGGVRTAAAIAYADTVGFEQIAGSASAILSSGFNLTVAAGSRDVAGATGDDPFFYYVKAGQQLDVFDIGRTSLAVDFTQVDDLDVAGDEFTSYGAFIVQNLDPVATQLYFGVRNHALDAVGGPDPDDIIAVLAGALIKF